MGNCSSSVMGPIYVPDANREFYWQGGDPESLKQLGRYKVVCCSRVYEDFSFGRRVCRLEEY